MIYVHLWKEKSRIYGFLVWPNLHSMLQSPCNAVSLEGEGERGWKLSLSLVSFFFSFLFLSLTNQLYHILSLSFFPLLLQAYIHSSARTYTHTVHTVMVWTLLISHMQAHYAHRRTLAHKHGAAQPLSNTFTSLAPILSHVLIRRVFSSFFLSLPGSAPPPSTASTYRSFLFIVKAIVPMATSELLIAKVLYV